MVSGKIRRSLVAIVLASSFGLLPPLAAQPRAANPSGTGGASAPGAPSWSLHLTLWHYLTTLLGKSGAKIDGNG